MGPLLVGCSKQMVALLAVTAVNLGTTFGADFLDPSYNKYSHTSEGSRTDFVRMFFSINSIKSVSEEDMTVTVDASVSATWNDKRLQSTYNSLFEEVFQFSREQCNHESCRSYGAYFGADFAEKIWKPDIEFLGGTSVQLIDEHVDSVCVRLDYGGDLNWSRRSMITFSCPMIMFQYPFDQHDCSLQFLSFKYNSDLVGRRIAIGITEGLYNQQTNKFVFEDFDFNKDHKRINATLFDGNRRTVEILDFHMTRKYKLILMQFFLPSFLLTALGWVTLWINPKRVPERSIISIIVILAQVVLTVGMAQQYPPNNDIEMTDLYVIVNFIFNIGSLIETILAANIGIRRYKEGTEVKSLVDSVFSVFFPLTFGIWNLLFFGYNIRGMN